MAIKYCDLYSGNDANDGLTPATPKKTLNAATLLVASINDEVRVRGKDDLFTDIGSWTWTNESRVITASGDLTGSVAAGDWVCKTIISSGTTVPELYYISTVVYAGGITTITFFLTTTYNYYVGATETIATSKLSLPSAVDAQLIGKTAYYSGTLTDWTGRILTNITGGWNSGYTTQNNWTCLFGAVNSLNFQGYSYWNISRFIMITVNASNISRSNYINIKDCFLSSQGAANLLRNNSNYVYYKNIKIIGSGLSLVRDSNYHRFDDCKILNCRGTGGDYGVFDYINNCIFNNCTLGLSKNKQVFSNGGTATLNNCTLLNVNYPMHSATVSYSGCTIQDIGNVANISFPITSNVNKCIFDMNRNRTTGYVVGSVYPVGTFTFLNNSGETGQYMRMNIGGEVYNTTRFKLWQGATTFSYLKWYNINNENLGVSDFTSNSYYDAFSKNIIYSYTTGSTKNVILSKYGYTTLSDDYYSGKTTGQNSILHVVGTNNAACDFQNVDFVIDKSTAYNLSFYAKGSGSYTMHWNIFNGGQYLYAWQTQAITAGAWTNITKAIAASDWKMSGTATLVIRIPSQAKGTYALIDYIQLT